MQRSKYTEEQIKSAYRKYADSHWSWPDLEKIKGMSKQFTEYHLLNLAKANLESKGKVVECYNLEGNFIEDFSCLREAKNWLLNKNPLISTNVDKQIKDCCNGRQKTCHGYKFKYKE